MKKTKRTKKKYNLERRIISALRKVFFYSPIRAEAVKNAKTKQGGYKCNECGTVSAKAIIDHIRPVVHPKRGFSGWSDYVDRLFCSPRNLQNLCKPCHYAKSKTERRIREVIRLGGE